MMNLPTCTTDGCTGERRFVAQDENEAVRLAGQGKLDAYCVRCDSRRPLPKEEQEAIARNLSALLSRLAPA